MNKFPPTELFDPAAAVGHGRVTGYLQPGILMTPRKVWVTIKPLARTQEVRESPGGGYSVLVRSPAREGKANEELLGLLAKHFSVSRSSVRIRLGKASRRKLVEID